MDVCWAEAGRGAQPAHSCGNSMKLYTEMYAFRRGADMGQREAARAAELVRCPGLVFMRERESELERPPPTHRHGCEDELQTGSRDSAFQILKGSLAPSNHSFHPGEISEIPPCLPPVSY